MSNDPSRHTPAERPEIVVKAMEIIERDDRENDGPRILRPGITDEYLLAKGVLEFYERAERAIDATLEKILAASDDQIAATLRAEGHDPKDVATIAKQVGEIAILRHDLETARSASARIDPPASPLPWRLQDDIIFDATGESILGHDPIDGLPMAFACEMDADFIMALVEAYTSSAYVERGGKDG